MQCKGIGGLCEKDEIGESVQCPFGEKTCMYVAYECKQIMIRNSNLA